LSIFELFGALSWGGKVILVEDALDLATSPRRNDVTLVNSVPSIVRTLLEGDGLPQSVRTVNLAGEPLSEELVEAKCMLLLVKPSLVNCSITFCAARWSP